MNTILAFVLVLIPVAYPVRQLPSMVSQTRDDLSVSLKDLRNVPTEVVLDGRSLSLSAYLWRDFMPGGSLDGSSMIDGRPMIAALKIATIDKKSFPSGVRIDRAWVLFGEQMWATSQFRDQVKDSSNNDDSWVSCLDAPVCEAVARGGPKWGPGIYVDVVVRLTDREGRHHLLQAPKQLVRRAD